MARGDQFGRQWKILKKLETSRFGVPLKDLHFDVSEFIPCTERTILRDLEALEAGGVPIYNDKVDGITKYFVTENFLKKMSEIPFKLSEVIAIYLSYDYLKCLMGTVFHDSIKEIYDKVKAVLSPKMLELLGDIQEGFHAGYKSRKDYSKYKKIINDVNRAVLERKVIQIIYTSISSSEESIRKVEPYMVWLVRDVLYMIGFCHKRNDFRTFAIHRIKELKILNEKFTPSLDFSFSNYIKDTFEMSHGEIKNFKIWFGKSLAAYIKEDRVHPSQKIVEDKEGNIILEFETGGEERVKSWVLSFGRKAHLIEPFYLSKSIEDEIGDMARNYEKIRVDKDIAEI